ncbi:MAG: hypothetical protein V4697_03025 [Patescibacteria group bacterium]
MKNIIGWSVIIVSLVLSLMVASNIDWNKPNSSPGALAFLGVMVALCLTGIIILSSGSMSESEGESVQVVDHPALLLTNGKVLTGYQEEVGKWALSDLYKVAVSSGFQGKPCKIVFWDHDKEVISIRLEGLTCDLDIEFPLLIMIDFNPEV